MKFFPTTERSFRLIDTQSKTIDRLKRRTDPSEKLTFKYTDRSFRGMITENKFKLISSAIRKNVFCVMKGEINDKTGYVCVEIHKAFKVLLSIILCFPMVGITIAILVDKEKFHPVLILVAILQFLMIRYIFIAFAFKYASGYSMNRLRDVLDVEFINK
ncbi:hypothetical protein U8527_08285 [Kordia algicida OT-1]|uniref:Uncharacterized protein n=1 Tax=Kordia algicida OT-1 TaxID=391587 RepID=A9E6D0_9FLAO|nr:hypothetical protein [Kordia algicida]EDP95013.1 hypothetical protein KAOT1_01719 [Kordia algicida OT-1]